MDMVISAASTLALFCSRCGKIHMHDFSRFTFKNRIGQPLTCTCGQVQATIISMNSHQLLLDIPCVICQTNHVICIESKRFWQNNMDKIYCVQGNFELGFVGDKQKIADIVTRNKREFENLIYDMDDCGEYVENPQVMIEILNRIHDIAELGKVYCRCGSKAIEVELLPDGILLECSRCGGHVEIKAYDEKDLASMESVEKIEIIPPRRIRRKHDK
jgi:hypothetical protein